ncbi:MAG: outer membrane protein transport protein [Flavobacteriaceae bacterium]|jgi:hypothetical protein|nr:outer membrane protein transport protein [Flavobacteriaceae bacterium]
MKKRVFCIVVFLAIVQAGKAQTNNFYPNDVSDALTGYSGNFNTSGTARYIGMGESMGALGGDLSAVETNPAGLGIFRSSTANITLNVLGNKNQASMSGSRSTSETNFDLSNAGVVFAFGADAVPWKVNFALNCLSEWLDNDVSFPENKNIFNTYSSGDTYHFKSWEQSVSGYKLKTKVSVAANYKDTWYFGAGLDFHYLSMDRSSLYQDVNSATGETAYSYEQYTPYSQEASGFGFSVGVIGKITPEFRLGAAYKSPVWWSDIRNEFSFYKNNQSDKTYYYFDGNRNTAPGNVTLSAAYASDISPDGKQSLAANFDFVNYFNKDYKFSGRDEEYKSNNYFVDNYMQSSQEYRFGVEYRYDFLKLRAGYGYAGSPVKDKSVYGSLTPSDGFNAQVKNYLGGERNKFGAGIGFDWGSFFADFAYQWIQQNYYTSFAGDFYESQNLISFPTEYSYFGKIKNTQNNFILTLGIRF